MPVLSEQQRAYIYRIVLALSAIALVYGVVEDGDIDKWVGLATAILGIGGGGLAAKNTSTDPEKPKTIDGQRSARLQHPGSRDVGQAVPTVIWWVVGVLAAIALIIWIMQNVDTKDDAMNLTTLAINRWS